MIVWTIEAAMQAACIGTIFVSTEDDEIAGIARSVGASIIDRPIELAADETSSEDVLYHAVAEIERKVGDLPDAFVFMQCTSPLTASEDIENAMRILDSENADSVVSVTPAHVFLWRENDAKSAEPVNHDIHYRPRRQELQPEYNETGAVYAIRTQLMLKQRTRYCGIIKLLKVPMHRSFEIDSLEDLRLLETLLSESLRSGRKP